jgi:hypothetical protein
MIGQVSYLKASQTYISDENKQLHTALIQKQLDIEYKDRVICEQIDDLKHCRNENCIMKGQLQESVEKNATLQSKLDEQDKHGKEVFTQNYLTLCIWKYFYIFGLFTDS